MAINLLLFYLFLLYNLCKRAKITYNLLAVIQKLITFALCRCCSGHFIQEHKRNR